MYKELESMPDLPKLESQVSEYWKKEDLISKLKKLRQNSEEKVYYDGPITANGLPHYGHAIAWTLKDVIPRFWSMQGFLVLRNMGWDCQGIPVEYEVEKELKFKSKSDIEQYGVEKFNALCRTSVQKYQSVMFQYEALLGRWYDPKEIYATMDPNYIESMWWSLKELYTKGLLYEGYKVVAYSTRAGTTLSTHEVSEGGYKDVEDPFVTVKFKLVGEKNTYFLAWTTTPWTIPGNLMLAVGKDIKYARVEVGNEVLILAQDRVKDVIKGLDSNDGLPVKDDVKIVGTIKGSDLKGLTYDPPYSYFESKRKEGCFKVVESAHAQVGEGTGIVHLAPYGEDDFEIFQSLNISLFDYLDETANFTSTIPEFSGMFYKDANPLIIEDLKNKDRLYDTGSIIHRMPMCWRTNTPLIYRPVKSWYVAVTKIKKELIKNNEEINWRPEHLKEGNSGVWIKNARDWALSRNRYWGTPLPVWIDDKTGEKVFVGSFEELRKLSGVGVTDPHRPFVDNITWKAKSGGTFKRVKDVIDVWYDSASMPFARFHYPFENKERFKTGFPAEYIAEGSDQVRLWFYVMHVLGQALFDKAPYKAALTSGTMLDESGKKMSKSKRNYKPMDSILSEYGGDVLRYYILTSPIVEGEDAIFSEEFLKNSKKDFFLPLWNCLRYLITNANLHEFTDSITKVKSLDILDHWILIRKQKLVNDVYSKLSEFRIMEASRSLSLFVSDLSTWYIRRSRDRLSLGDKEALGTLFEVLRDFTLVMAPFVPFLAETFNGVLENGKGESVHTKFFPKVVKLTKKDLLLLIDMQHVRDVAEKGNSQRKELGIKIRQPLREIKVVSDKKLLNKRLAELIKDELNVKEISFSYSDKNEMEVTLDTILDENLKNEGLARDLVRAIQDLRKKSQTNVESVIDVEYEENPELNKALVVFGDYVKKRAKVKKLSPGVSLKITS